MKQREPTVGLPRYGIIDAYTLEELRREYQNSDAKGRVRLLENLSEDNRVTPYEIALLAVEDQNVEVRQWIARHGKLDYREGRREKEEQVYKYPDRNLNDRPKNDPDPFVRACLRENPDALGWFGFGSEDFFKEATCLERLALVRNPNVSDKLIEKIFDPEDKELGIDLEERKELVLAYLTNGQNLDDKRERVKQDEPPFGTSKHLAKLWRFISKWPSDGLGNVVYKVYGVLPNPFEFEDEIYTDAEGKVGRLRWVLEDGMKDADDRLRYLAYTKVSCLEPQEIEAILVGNDMYALDGLYHNRSLYLASKLLHRRRLPKGREQTALGYSVAAKVGAQNWYTRLYWDGSFRCAKLEKVLGRRASPWNIIFNRVEYRQQKRHLEYIDIFTDLRNHIRLRLEEFFKNDSPLTAAFISLERRADFDPNSLDEEVKKMPAANPSELFDRTERPSESNFLEDKIDFIGKSLLMCEELIRGLYKAVVILVIIYIAWRLLGWLLG